MNDDKVKRLLHYIGFLNIEDLTITKKELKYSSVQLKVINKEQKVVFICDVYKFPNQPTQWYVNIPVMLEKNHKIIPLANIASLLITEYCLIQSKYLKLFDKLHKNAIYQSPYIDLDMVIIDDYDETMPEPEFNIIDLEFRSKVIHHKIHQESISANIEGITKRQLFESGLFDYSEHFILTDDVFNKALLLSDMLTV